MKYSKFTSALFFVFFAGCCVNVSANDKEDVKAAKEIEWQADYAVSVVIDENLIVLSEPVDKTVLNEIPVVCDVYKIFISMTDEKNGYMICCGTPESGRTTKFVYVTKDRWNTYSKMDVEMDMSFMLDE